MNDYVPCDFYVTLSEMTTMTAQHFNLKGNFNFKPEQVKLMIEEGERYALQIINELALHRDTKRLKQTEHDLYYYLSGARLLSILNRLLKIGKDKRISCLAKVKKFRNK